MASGGLRFSGRLEAARGGTVCLGPHKAIREAAAAFGTLSFSHRREYVQWITDATKPATPACRVARTHEKLRG